MKTSIRSLAAITSAATLLIAQAAQACDVCGCYTPNHELNSEPFDPTTRGFYAASAEQYTFFGTTKFSGHEVPNVADQYEHSSITQLIAGYRFNDRIGAQFGVPLIYRDYKRPEGFATDRGTESGIGDASLLFNFVPYRYESKPARADVSKDSGKDAKDGKEIAAALSPQRPDFSFSLNVIAGVKFPTGDSRRIAEEFNEVEVAGAPKSGIHGHDLALGSGSYDAVFGLGVFTRYRSGFFQANVEYTVRTRGDYDYRYANDISFDVGPGVFLLQERPVKWLGPVTFGVQCVLSGEHKNRDTFMGETEVDTGATALYVGPRLVATIGRRFVAEAGADLPVLIDNTDFQVVPSYRIRAGASWSF